MSSVHFARLMESLHSDAVDRGAIRFGQTQFRQAHVHTSKSPVSEVIAAYSWVTCVAAYQRMRSTRYDLRSTSNFAKIWFS
jgi:hypothetical protein